ncbi:FAD-dependent oxidoreductase domain-containing protein 1 homolog [Rhynchophorus ferrugineus]|uniref:FAD-dependent oxidoreductase domain-containing protein 1 homolog n=1 Tax=Rhynchophorus ferrugineus TaxID=354439 RepID=UPI003FCE853E
MLFKTVLKDNVSYLIKRSLHKNVCLSKRENPIERTFRIISSDIQRTFSKIKNFRRPQLVSTIPTYTDILVVGGGAMGSSVAYWLKEKTNFDSFNLVVLEKDMTFSKCSTSLSVGGLRQQFSLPENIQMSLYGFEFIRTLKRRFGPEAEVNFTPHGYLVLASEEGAEQLIDNSKIQRDLGASNIILNANQLKDRFPWMNVDGIELGCLGLEKEGWFDPWSLLHILKKGAIEKGAQYIHGEAVDFKFEVKEASNFQGAEEDYHCPSEVVIKLANGQLINMHFSLCIIAAGSESGKIGESLNIGTGKGILTVPIPVERRKRYVYSFRCQGEPPGLNSPMTIDPTGAYFRRNGLGGDFIAGLSPDIEDEPDTSNLDVNYEFFDQKLWPILANRAPVFNAVKVNSAWSGFYDYNTFDENGIIGSHPYYSNIFLATGFSGHGIQQAPAVGRAIAELILKGRFQTIDLTRLGFNRLLLQEPMNEIQII